MILRRLLNFAAALSLLICLLTTVLMIRSYWRRDTLEWATPHGKNETWQYDIASSRGILFYISGWAPPPTPVYEVAWITRPSSRFPDTIIGQSKRLHWREFSFYWQPDGSEIRLPHYAIITGSILLPFCWLAWRWNHRKKRFPEDCLNCGYNLTGNTSGVCPECGTAAPSTAEPVA